MAHSLAPNRAGFPSRPEVGLRGAREVQATRVWLRLYSCTNLIERALQRGLRVQFGTTLPRFDLLAQLEAAERQGTPWLTLSELSRRLMVSNGNLTGLTTRMVRERLVSRSTSPDDARTQLVRLTSRGRQAFSRQARQVRRWLGRWFAALSDREVAGLAAGAAKLKRAVEGPPSEGGP